MRCTISSLAHEVARGRHHAYLCRRVDRWRVQRAQVHQEHVAGAPRHFHEPDAKTGKVPLQIRRRPEHSPQRRHRIGAEPMGSGQRQRRSPVGGHVIDEEERLDAGDRAVRIRPTSTCQFRPCSVQVPCFTGDSNNCVSWTPDGVRPPRCATPCLSSGVASVSCRPGSFTSADNRPICWKTGRARSDADTPRPACTRFNSRSSARLSAASRVRGWNPSRRRQPCAAKWSGSMNFIANRMTVLRLGDELRSKIISFDFETRGAGGVPGRACLARPTLKSELYNRLCP